MTWCEVHREGEVLRAAAPMPAGTDPARIARDEAVRVLEVRQKRGGPPRYRVQGLEGGAEVWAEAEDLAPPPAY